MITANISKRRENRGLDKVSEEVRQNIVNGTRILREVKSDKEKNELIDIRGEFYSGRGIAEPCYGEDPFDREARFFVLEGCRDDKKYISKGFVG